MKLIGAETINHRIEAQLNETSDFKHIADAKANYSSELIFDDSGRIIERKIKGGDYKCAMHISFKENGIYLPDDCSDVLTNDKSKQDGNSRKIGNSYSNSIVIRPIKIQEHKKEDNYVKALKLYIDKRKQMHDKLAVQGCGVVTIEPERVENKKAKESMKPSIVFLCYKDSPEKSHVRVMVRD